MTQRQINLILSGIRKGVDNVNGDIIKDCGDAYVLGKMRECMDIVRDFMSNDEASEVITGNYQQIVIYCLHAIDAHMSKKKANTTDGDVAACNKKKL